jgi:hypothetical protein
LDAVEEIGGQRVFNVFHGILGIALACRSGSSRALRRKLNDKNNKMKHKKSLFYFKIERIPVRP